eukprot:12321731-Alexandrium_andersonii.AAC.1
MIGEPGARPSWSPRLGAWSSRIGQHPAMSLPPRSPARPAPPFASHRSTSLAAQLLTASTKSWSCP